MIHGFFHKKIKEEGLVEKDISELKKNLLVVENIFFNRVAYIIGIGSSLLNIPQLWSIWSTQDASGVSVASWVGFSLASLYWLFYAIYHKENILIYTFGITLLFQVFIVLGAVVF